MADTGRSTSPPNMENTQMDTLETPAAHYTRLAAEGWADPDLPAADSAQVTADGGRPVSPGEPKSPVPPGA